MHRLSAPCPCCPKTVAIKLSTDRLIVHDTPQGQECEGSEALPPQEVPVAPSAVKEKHTGKGKGKGKGKTARKPQGKGGSVWTVSGGLPGLGKRR